MAGWVRAAIADAGDRAVVAVIGGFHRSALMGLTGAGSWPGIPQPPDGAVGSGFLVPYSFKRLDAFVGYQSGMPSPEYYQQLWHGGSHSAAAGLIETVVTRLRRRGVAVSTADLIAARALTEGLIRLCGHRHPSRTDVLDGLVSALVTTKLDTPLPWASRGRLAAGTEPVVVEMVAALSGNRVGRLHPDTPAPPLVHNVQAELERQDLDGTGRVNVDLTVAGDLERSRVLHRLRVLGIPGFTRESGPASGVDPVLDETWILDAAQQRLPALIEAGAYGVTLRDSASAVLAERVAGEDLAGLSAVLFDAALCGIRALSEEVGRTIAASVGAVSELGALGPVLGSALGLWRYDRLLGVARSPTLGVVITASIRRVLWLAEGIRGGPAPADLARLAAVVATRDALVHAGARRARPGDDLNSALIAIEDGGDTLSRDELVSMIVLLVVAGQ